MTIHSTGGQPPLNKTAGPGPKAGLHRIPAWGEEWCYNNVDFLDRIVQLLDLEIVSPQCELRGNSGVQEFQGGLG